MEKSAVIRSVVGILEPLKMLSVNYKELRTTNSGYTNARRAQTCLARRIKSSSQSTFMSNNLCFLLPIFQNFEKINSDCSSCYILKKNVCRLNYNLKYYDSGFFSIFFFFKGCIESKLALFEVWNPTEATDERKM